MQHEAVGYFRFWGGFFVGCCCLVLEGVLVQQESFETGKSRQQTGQQ